VEGLWGLGGSPRAARQQAAGLPGPSFGLRVPDRRSGPAARDGAVRDAVRRRAPRHSAPARGGGRRDPGVGDRPRETLGPPRGGNAGREAGGSGHGRRLCHRGQSREDAGRADLGHRRRGGARGGARDAEHGRNDDDAEGGQGRARPGRARGAEAGLLSPHADRAQALPDAGPDRHPHARVRAGGPDHDPRRSPVTRRPAAIATGIALVIALGALAWGAFAPLPATCAAVSFVIPPGAAARLKAGEPLTILPSPIFLTVGVRDVLVITNDDE